MKRYQLSKAGVSASEGIERMNGDQKAYEDMLNCFPEDTNYEQLCQAIEKKDVKSAFVAAHSLKGIAGNLSMKRLYGDIYPLVELLREEKIEGAGQYLNQVKEDYQAIVNAIR